MAVINRQEKKKSLLNALNNPKYEWRTIPGLSKEADLDTAEVMDILADLRKAGLVIRSDTPSKDGHELFISRDKFNRRSSLGEKILGAIKNRIS